MANFHVLKAVIDGQAVKSICSSTSLPFEKVAPISSRSDFPFPEGSVAFGFDSVEGKKLLLDDESLALSQLSCQNEPSSDFDGRVPLLYSSFSSSSEWIRNDVCCFLRAFWTWLERSDSA